MHKRKHDQQPEGGTHQIKHAHTTHLLNTAVLLRALDQMKLKAHVYTVSMNERATVTLIRPLHTNVTSQTLRLKA